MPYNQKDYLDEKIWVWALFKSGKVFPRIFWWKDKLYRITKITYNWQTRKGQDLISYFSVDTPVGLYEISFSSNGLCWRLTKIIK